MRIMGLVFIVILILVILGCGDSGTATPATPTESPSPTPTETPHVTPTPTPTLTPSVSPEPSPSPGTPVAVITEISPNPAYVRDKVSFSGGAEDPASQVSEYLWSVEGHGPIAYRESFKTSTITSEPGTYTVVLKVKDRNGVWSEPVEETLEVLPLPPTAIFTGQPVSGPAPLWVSFIDRSAREVDSWHWDFGDGTTSTSENPIHQYEEPGFYTVTLRVVGPDGTHTEVKEDYIEVLDVNFVASPVSGYSPLEVQFTDKTIGDIESWGWRFGDGTSSTLRNPVHTYTELGTYSVELTVVSKNGGVATGSKHNYIRVLEAPPEADFYAHSETYVGHTEQFTDRSRGKITSWSWNFGDGTTSNVKNPTHTYYAPGSYVVSLTVTGPGGSDSVQQTVTVFEWE